MATTFLGKPSIDIAYTLTETNADTTITESTTVGNTIVFVQGSGTGAGNMGALSTGYLPSGGTLVLDLKALSKSMFGSSLTLDYSKINGLLLTADWRGPPASGLSYGTGVPAGFPVDKLPYFTLNGTGINGFTNVFNGETGNVRVGYRGTWSSTWYEAISTSASQKDLSLVDSGSGISYQFMVIGSTG